MLPEGGRGPLAGQEGLGKASGAAGFEVLVGAGGTSCLPRVHPPMRGPCLQPVCADLIVLFVERAFHFLSNPHEALA